MMSPSRTPAYSLDLLATVFVDLVDEQIAAGRWEVRPDGELVPVDTGRGKVVQLFVDPSRLGAVEEENDAPLQRSSAPA